ncbi:MAG: efflux RND transporter periplasmic adaptor subunit [Chitinophagaceae bacterium]|nr:efflux RND transporter periplasmic adaptor subunit [Chitinophagaceae bacterium]
MQRILHVALAILFISCSRTPSTQTTESVPEVPVVKVFRQNTELTTGYVANIKAVRNTEIRSRVHGFLERVLVDEGKYVQAGQPLFQLSTGEYRIAVAKAEALLASANAEAKTAELEMERVSALVEKNVITNTERELAKAKIQMAQARINEAKASLEEAKLKMEYTLIKAPFAGIVNKIPLRLGSLIEEGTLLTTLSDVSAVFAYFNVSENDYLRFNAEKNTPEKDNDAVDLILSDGKFFSEKGIIETMEGEFDESTGAIAFRARFPNPGAVLKHGATGKIMLTSHEAGALLIPQKSVFEIQDRYFVYVVDKNGKITQRAIVPKVRLEQYYVVASGLQEGELIVYEGTQNLRNGNSIKMREVSASEKLTDTAGR